MAITNPTAVREAAGLTTEYTDAEINTEIDFVEAELYRTHRLPKRSSYSVDDDYTNFYISNDDVHEITRMQVSVETTTDPSGWLAIGSPDYYSFTEGNNYITATGSLISNYDTKLIRVQYIPQLLHLLATSTAALNLVDQTTIVDGEEVIPPQVTRLKAKITRLTRLLKPRKMIKSSDYVNYDRFDYESISQIDYR